MSEPSATTGEVETRRCAKCEQATDFRKRLGLYGTVAWHATQHEATCGLPCFGAGISLTAFRTKQFHRSMDECPRCKPLVATVGEQDHPKLPEGN